MAAHEQGLLPSGRRLAAWNSIDVGAGSARFHQLNAGVRVTGATVIRSTVEATLRLTAATYLRATVEVDSIVSEAVRRAVDEPVLVHGGVAAGVEI